MLPDKNIRCHRTGFARTCASIVGKGQCRLYMQLMGMHPQTGEQLNKWGCADEFLPMLLIENSQQQRQTGAAVESFRNEMVSANDRALDALSAPARIVQDKLIKERR
jgi:hypothetical protein